MFGKDVWQQIMRHLETRDVLTLRLVCKMCYRVSVIDHARWMLELRSRGDFVYIGDNSRHLPYNCGHTGLCHFKSHYYPETLIQRLPRNRRSYALLVRAGIQRKLARLTNERKRHWAAFAEACYQEGHPLAPHRMACWRAAKRREDEHLVAAQNTIAAFSKRGYL